MKFLMKLLGWRECNELVWIDRGGVEHFDSLWPDGKGHERLMSLKDHNWGAAFYRRRWLRVKP